MRTRSHSIAWTALVGLLLLSSCAGQHVRRGDQAYALMAYERAGRHYDKALRRPVDRAVLLRAADALRRRNDTGRALGLYQAAETMAPLSGDDAFRFGQVLMSTARWKEAADLFHRVLDDRPEDRAAMELYASCLGYRSFKADSGRYVVTELPLEGISTAFSAVPYRNGIVFTGEREVGSAKANPWNGMSFLDIYYSERKGAFWREAEALKGVVNGPYHEGPMAFSPDGRTLYFSRSNYYGRKLLKGQGDVSHLKMFRATLNDQGEWTDLREFPYNSEDWSVGHPTLSRDGRVLYFASDMPGGQGGTDIWRCVDNGHGWDRPENLGSTINGPGNEMFPVVNGDALYFSSTAHDNMGGLDIFESHMQGGYWSEPKNLLYPINTEHDDFGMVLDSTGTAGYLSSDRTGIDRVHHFTVNEPEFVLEGVVVDERGLVFLPNVEVRLESDRGDTRIAMTSEGGVFKFDLEPGRQYTVKTSAPGMLTRSVPVSTVGITANTVLREKLALPRMEMERPVVEVNVLFDFNKWDIRPDAAAELNKLARVIADNPGFMFELSAHTDSRGGDTYNLVLSDARAKSAVDYLMRQGVGPDQLRAQGYGETRLLNRCANGVRCTEEEHQANRRLEFTVVALREQADTSR